MKSSDFKFQLGRDNLTLTILMPIKCETDCGNTDILCSFKKEYQKNSCNYTAVLETITKFFEKEIKLSRNVRDVVITGCEPMADVEMLKKIIEQIPNDRNVYITTALTAFYDEGCSENLPKFIALVNHNYKIKGVNVLRYCASFEEEEALGYLPWQDEKLLLIDKPIEIVYNLDNSKLELEKLKYVYDRWERIRQMRQEYSNAPCMSLGLSLCATCMFTESLHKLFNPINTELEIIGGKLLSYDGNDTYDTTVFEMIEGGSDTKGVGNKGMIVKYVRKLQQTSQVINDMGAVTFVVNDFVIRQDGLLFYDLDMRETGKIHGATGEIKVYETRIQLNGTWNQNIQDIGIVGPLGERIEDKEIEDKEEEGKRGCNSGSWAKGTITLKPHGRG